MKHLCSFTVACWLALAVIDATPVPKAAASPRDSIMQRVATSIKFLSHASPRSDLQRAKVPSARSPSTRQRLQKRAVKAADSPEEARVRHLYTVYETILNSESQMPMFWNHQQQAGNQKRTRKQEQHQQDSHPATTNNGIGGGAESIRQKAIDGTSSKLRHLGPSPSLKQSQMNLREPREAPQAQQYQQPQKSLQNAVQKKQPSSLRKLAKVGNKTLDKSTARARIEEGISTIKTMFDSVFRTDTPGSEALGLVPDSILQAAMSMQKGPASSAPIALAATSEEGETTSAPEHCHAPTTSSVYPPCGVGGTTDASETFQKALHELEHTLEEAVAAAAVAQDNTSENDSAANPSSSKTKKSVIIINDHEYEHDDERTDNLDHDNGSDRRIITTDQTARMDPAPLASGPRSMDSENEEFILPFLHLRPSTKPFDFPGSDVFFTGTALQRILASFALVLFGLLLFLLVISYKMQARRRTASSPLAFFQYMTKGLLFSPFAGSPMATPSSDHGWTRRSSRFSKSPASFLGRSGSGAVLPEPVVASSSSSKTGSVMTDLRRTSASQYHLQQQLETAHVVHKAPV
ncbi:hypothetical protein BGZ67_005308 [Mortierella alpina]|nr:hypothetical protein BGZ67_005308 [Mortierella alpina]